MRDLISEHPRHAWPEDLVNVKDRVVLDLGCGFFGTTQFFKQNVSFVMRGTDRIGLPYPEMISTSEYWLNLGAKKVIGVDVNLNDLEFLSVVLGDRNVQFIHDQVRSPEQVKNLIDQHFVDVVKADIEGHEFHLLDLKDDDFRLVKEWYIEAHSHELIQRTKDKMRACGYEVRGILRMNPDTHQTPQVIFGYRA